MTLTISEKLEQFHENNEHGKILKKIKDGKLTYRNVINDWVDEVQSPIIREALNHESSFFYRDKPSKGFGTSKKSRIFDAGRSMMRHPNIYHPLLHPSIPNLITAFYVDEAPLIYCNSNYGDKGEKWVHRGLEFQPYDTVFTEDWVKVVERNKLKFVLSPEDIEWRGGEAEFGEHKSFQTTVLSFETEKDLFLPEEDF